LCKQRKRCIFFPCCEGNSLQNTVGRKDGGQDDVGYRIKIFFNRDRLARRCLAGGRGERNAVAKGENV
jgi:hypothetical protein